jgi:hypothetical protein
MSIKKCGVYAIWVKELSGVELPYIGSSKNMLLRKKQHFSALNLDIHANWKLQNAWNKYSSSAFRFEIILECEEMDRFLLEELSITLFDSYHNGYNLTPNVLNSINYRLKLSEKHKNNISLATKKRYESQIERDKTSKSIKQFWSENWDKVVTLEYRQRMKMLYLKANLQDPEIINRRILALRKVASTQEHRNKLSIAAKGKKKSKEHCIAISKGAKKKYEDPEERRKTSESLKTPEAHEKLSKGVKLAWKNPQYRENLVRERKGRWKDPEYKKRTGNSIKQAYALLNADPERSAARSKAISEALKRSWQRKKAKELTKNEESQ